MVDRRVLRGEQWVRIALLLPGKASDCGDTAKDNRLFIEGVLWIARTGSPLRDLPREYGHWHRVYVRCNHRSYKGILQQIFEAVVGDPDLEYLMIDVRIAHVHQRGAAQIKNKQSKPEADPWWAEHLNPRYS